MWTRFLEWLLQWTERRLHKQYGDPRFFRLHRPSRELVEAAVWNVEAMNRQHHLSGETKRDKCYKMLCKKFPNVPKSDIALAIEIGYQCG